MPHADLPRRAGRVSPSFRRCDLGYFDEETGRLESIANRFGPNLVTHPLGTKGYEDYPGPACPKSVLR
jgi:hypothetical protein